MKTGKFMTAFGLLLLSGCAGSGKPGEADSDTAAVDTEIAADTVVAENRIFLTKDSIGQVFVGMSVNEVPDSVPGLYTRKVEGASPDAVTLTFSNPDGEQFIAYDFGEGKIDVINVIGDDVRVSAPRGAFGLGDKFSKVLELPGVAAEWSGYDGNGCWYWVWEGMWFAPSQNHLSETLSRRLYHPDMAPTVADFDENVTIGFIGTGLPF